MSTDVAFRTAASAVTSEPNDDHGECCRAPLGRHVLTQVLSITRGRCAPTQFPYHHKPSESWQNAFLEDRLVNLATLVTGELKKDADWQGDDLKLGIDEAIRILSEGHDPPSLPHEVRLSEPHIVKQLERLQKSIHGGLNERQVSRLRSGLVCQIRPTIEDSGRTPTLGLRNIPADPRSRATITGFTGGTGRSTLLPGTVQLSRNTLRRTLDVLFPKDRERANVPRQLVGTRAAVYAVADLFMDPQLIGAEAIVDVSSSGSHGYVLAPVFKEFLSASKDSLLAIDTLTDVFPQLRADLLKLGVPVWCPSRWRHPRLREKVHSKMLLGSPDRRMWVEFRQENGDVLDPALFTLSPIESNDSRMPHLDDFLHRMSSITPRNSPFRGRLDRLMAKRGHAQLARLL